MNHFVSEYTVKMDLHNVLKNPDFSKLDKLYEGRCAFYGDYHDHGATGGTSDGKTTLEEWKEYMDKLHIDFIGIMDHRQVRHMYLDGFDPAYFLYGSEPGGEFIEPNLKFHYIMIFEQRDCLEKILHKFPDVFEFTGGVEGHFVYKPVERARFMEVVDAVRELGGVFVHPHPKQVMVSDNIDDYYFGEGTVIETIYVLADEGTTTTDATTDNYKLWLELLARGKKVINTASADCHGVPHTWGLNTVYATERICSKFVERLREGDLNAGYIGIKMSVDDNPVGSSVKYKDGMNLYIKAEDAHPINYNPDEKYRIDVYSDEGLAYSAPLKMPFKVAIQVEKRRFYRVEIIRESDGSPAAIGNPIWIY